MSQHTPGPWTIHDQVDSEGFTIIKGQGLRLAKVTNSEPDWAEANARLIAAAPELLEDCEATMRDLNTAIDHLNIWNFGELQAHLFGMQQKRAEVAAKAKGYTTIHEIAARAAIAKAEGRA